MDHIQDDAISERETQVLLLVAAGKRNKEIAAELSIAEDTVKMHVGNIFAKLNVTDRTDAVTVCATPRHYSPVNSGHSIGYDTGVIVANDR